MCNIPESMEKILPGNRILRPTDSNLKLRDNTSKMEICVSDVPKDTIAIQILSNGEYHLNAVEAKPGHKQSCDFIICTYHNGETDIYFLEMKTTHGDQNIYKACIQIIATIPIFKYLKAMAKIHYCSTEKTNKHFVVVFENTSPRDDKQGIKYTPIQKKTVKNKNFKIFISPNIPFNQLKL